MKKRRISYKNPDDLTPYARNPRRHSKKQIRQIQKSISTFGFNVPIIVDKKNTVVAGHGRLEAAKQLGLNEIPTIAVTDLTAEQIKAYIIADNRLAENSSWDEDALRIELQELASDGVDLDLTVTGFGTPEIDLIIGAVDEREDDALDDAIPEYPVDEIVSRPGDVWQIGDHRLACGDALIEDTFKVLMGGQHAQLIFTDPPYNVEINGHVSGLGSVKHREFAMATGEMESSEFQTFLETVFRHLSANSADGSLHYVCMDWRHLKEITDAGASVYDEMKNLCVWAKSNGGMGSLYRSQHELIFIFKSGAASHINNVELGKHGRNRSNVWRHPGISSFGKNRDAILKMHPTVKPVGLVADAILDASDRGGIVLDAFAGSGTTLVAAAQTGRKGYGIEFDPGYCDVIVKRLTALLDTPAIHSESGLRYAEIAKDRHVVFDGNHDAALVEV